MHMRFRLLCLPAAAQSRIALVSLLRFCCSCSATRLVLSAAVRASCGDIDLLKVREQVSHQGTDARQPVCSHHGLPRD